MNVEIGKFVKQKEGFKAFVPAPFPVKGLFDLPQGLLVTAAEAERYIGKLDGITHILPDVDFFLHMFVAKDAESSAQIEGTKATMIDALEKQAGVSVDDTDVDDILHYISALHYGTERLESLPLSLRLIREIHERLMIGARSTHFSNPGAFRDSQNWIGGKSPDDAFFVPPPVNEMKRALGDLETFLHDEKDILPLIHIGLAHAQFETIHPFLDGNGRTGRILITMLLYKKGLLERPVLFLSSYFRRHQKLYYTKLNGYHEGDVIAWLTFFLEGVIETAKEAIQISKEIRKIRDEDMEKIQALAKRESDSGILVLSHLFKNPIVASKNIMEWTGFTRAGAQKVLDRFVKLNILKAVDEKGTYDRKYIYSRYVKAFMNE